MIKQYFALLLTLLAFRANAQNNLVILTEKGALFTLFANDKQINDSAQSVVEAHGIFDDTCGVKLVFADKNSQPFSGKVYLTEGGKTVTGREFTYSLVNVKGKRSLKFISVNAAESDSAKKIQTPEVRINNLFIQTKKAEAEKNRLAENYPPPANCPSVISDTLLGFNLQKLRDEHIEMNRIKNVKWFISNNCINVKQLIVLLEVFYRQDSRIKIAEFAFPYLQDHRNFLEVTGSMKYPADKEELEKFYNKNIEK